MNLHYETVSPLLKETLQKLVNSPIFKDFTLIGGTCLSLQLGHRRSIDIDLFTDIDYGTMNTKALNSNHREVNRQYYPTEQLRQSNAIKKNDSTHKA